MVVMTDEQLVWRNQMPQRFRKNYDKAIDGKSKTAGIKGKCLDCMGWDRKAIHDCDISTCELFPYRPYQDKAIKG